jgi:hypothetical protein
MPHRGKSKEEFKMETTQSNTQERSKSQAKNKTTRANTIPKPTKHLANLLEWYGHLTERSVKHIHEFYSADAFFKDPLIEVYTTEEIQKHYLSVLDKISDVHFVFENILEQHNQAFVNWVMSARILGREFTVQGASHLKFAESGLCEYHRDYFDLSEEVYEQVPLLGLVFKGLKRVLN